MALGDWRLPISNNESQNESSDDCLKRLRAAFEGSKNKSWEAVSRELKSLGLDSKEVFAEFERRLGDGEPRSPSTRIFLKEIIEEWRSQSDE